MKGWKPLAVRAAVVAAVVSALALTGGARAHDIPPRPQFEGCHWWELTSLGGRISYDVSQSVMEWTEGVENWDNALLSLMHFDYASYPNGKTHLGWEGDWPSPEFRCTPPGEFAYACWYPVDPADCDDDMILTRAMIKFRPSSYGALTLQEEKIAVSAHEWGHNLNLGHTPGYFCDNPPRIMAEWGPDGEGCITGPSCPEQAAVIDYYMLLPWWHDRDGDCWANDDEDFIGTDDWDDCPDNTSDDAWPPDFNMDTKVNILDVVKFRVKLEHLGFPYDPRYHLTTDGRVNILDVVKMRPYITIIKRCTNP